MRSPNDVTQQAVRTLQDTLTNDCFRHTIPPPPLPPVQLEGEVNSFLS